MRHGRIEQGWTAPGSPELETLPNRLACAQHCSPLVSASRDSSLSLCSSPPGCCQWPAVLGAGTRIAESHLLWQARMSAPRTVPQDLRLLHVRPPTAEPGQLQQARTSELPAVRQGHRLQCRKVREQWANPCRGQRRAHHRWVGLPPLTIPRTPESHCTGMLLHLARVWAEKLGALPHALLPRCPEAAPFLVNRLVPGGTAKEARS
mmetsp:Transcript_33310/g.70462  ORF Transcript_33310/g.70462 Transcript_33310/m.70462 type:complete len:206 (-) Transcript_33310:179-796(-)